MADDLVSSDLVGCFGSYYYRTTIQHEISRSSHCRTGEASGVGNAASRINLPVHLM